MGSTGHNKHTSLCCHLKMENYTKGDVHEVEMPPVFTLDNSAVEMRVNANSKIRNLLGYSMKKIKEPEVKQMTWNASGNAITKAISCAEIMKRKIKGLHQVTKLRYRRIEECWEPKLEGLDRLKVNRDIPAICILLSKEPLDTTEDGYQAPGVFDAFWKSVQKDSTSSLSKRDTYHQRPKKPPYKGDNRKGTKRKFAGGAKKDSSGIDKSDT